MSKGGRQLLVYSMTLEAKEPLAMVLPIPIAKNAGEDAVRFINLEKYPEFFRDLNSGFFVPPPPAAESKGRGVVPQDGGRLQVHQVGSFEASFVPTQKDFSRLDERFRLPPAAFKKLPDYRDYGFAVFKLKAAAQTVHPMAFEFPTALATRLFFPTVHIHDGQVHEKEHFDHLLYCQPTPALHLKLSDWEESTKLASQFMDVKKTEGIVAPDEHCYKRGLGGLLQNKDSFVEAST